MKTFLVILATVLWTGVVATENKRTDLKAFTQDMVDYINGLGTTWKAGHNSYFAKVSTPVAIKMMGAKTLDNTRKTVVTREEVHDSEIPAEFDARLKWPNCPSISELRDQSNCGSCWAISTAATISDRICIASNGQDRPHISATDLLSCCKNCGDGCEGGDPARAFAYYRENGLVTGGTFIGRDGCRHYPLPPCEHYVNGSRPPCGHESAATPQCEHKCQSGYKKGYYQDKYYGAESYRVHRDQKAIQKEILTNGPVVAGYRVYEDFVMYKSGVYQHKAGSVVSDHAVRIVGWGEEQGTPYWLVANTWNSDWGDKGFFKIIRGTNDCGIEAAIDAGLPKVNKTSLLRKR